ncbi:MAG: LicD family protein [Hungatella sp.]|jgi:lipopolysaccharide cholinephosphotransferase|nr:LicD family protein [Hungatella sp.]
MKLMELKELQECEFEMLVKFRDYCDKHNLRYYLCGGTLIGAIRHKGFIPWDDDIDVMMPRPDLDKFLELNSTGKLDEYIAINDIKFDRNAISACTRLYDTRTELVFTNFRKPTKFGCWMDIFPLDGLPDSESERHKHFRKARIFMDLQILEETKIGSKRRSKIASILQFLLIPLLPFTYIIGKHGWNRILDNLGRKYDYSSANYVGVIEGRAGDKEAMLKNNMEPAVNVEFGGESFSAMANYDEYLTNLYGDYMIPPSEEDKKSRHELLVYRK